MEPDDQPGTHWVAMFFISPWESEFFDSYGFPPDTYGMDGYIERDATRYNNKPFQGLTSDTCGDYCLFYLFHLARNVDMDAIQAKFRSHDTQWNDAQVATFVHSYVKSLTSVRQRSPFFQSEHTCKSFKCWRKESIKCTSNFGISCFFVLCGQHGSVQMPEQCNDRRAESMWKDDVHKTITSVCRRFV